MRAAWVLAIRMGQRMEHEFRLRRFDGVYRWHLARAVPERDESGLLAGWIAVATDIDVRARRAPSRRVADHAGAHRTASGQSWCTAPDC